MIDRSYTPAREYDDDEIETAWQQFRKSIKKPRGKGKVNNSWGIYDAYKAIRKHKWFDIGRPVTEKEFYAIIRQINDLLAEEISKGTTVTLPSKMGKLELRKENRSVYFDKHGKMRVPFSIDWQATLKLWFEDEEAREEKLLIRRNSKTIYSVHFDKYNATFNNKLFYDFTLNRYIKRMLKNNINKGIIDSLYVKERKIHKHKEGT